MPESIDTPFFQHAANYSGRAVRAVPPVVAAERVAHTIVRMAERPRREVFVGLAARQFWLQYKLAPGLTERMFGLMADNFQLSKDQSAPQSQGSLFEPMMEGAGTSGGWSKATGSQTSTTGSRLPLAAGLAGLATLGVGLLAWNVVRGQPA